MHLLHDHPWLGSYRPMDLLIHDHRVSGHATECQQVRLGQLTLFKGLTSWAALPAQELKAAIAPAGTRCSRPIKVHKLDNVNRSSAGHMGQYVWEPQVAMHGWQPAWHGGSWQNKPGLLSMLECFSC